MNSSSRSRTEVFDANGRVVVGPGNFFLLIQSASGINVRFVRGGTTFGADNIEAGYVKGLVEPWERCYLDGGVPGSTVRFFTGDEQVDEDFTDYRRTIGVFQPQQPANVVDAADVVVGVGATAIVAANAARRRVTITNLLTSVGGIRVGAAGTVTAARGQPLQPGQSVSLEVSGAISGIQDGGGAATVAVLEEVY